MSDAAIRVEGRGTPGRCGRCHDDVRVEERVACARCLAVHHGDCWNDGGRCAACAALERLAPDGTGALDDDTTEVLPHLHGQGHSPKPDPLRRLKVVGYGSTALGFATVICLGLTSQSLVLHAVAVASFAAASFFLLIGLGDGETTPR